MIAGVVETLSFCDFALDVRITSFSLLPPFSEIFDRLGVLGLELPLLLE